MSIHAVSCKCDTDIIYPECGFCTTTDKKLSTCSICHIQQYCSSACMQADFRKHSPVCKRVSTKLNLQALEDILYNHFETPKLTEEQETEAEALICLQLASIIDSGAGQRKCKGMGQELFEKYKSGENSDSAGAILKRICKWISTNCADGSKRSAAIAVAWRGIGDCDWLWT